MVGLVEKWPPYGFYHPFWAGGVVTLRLEGGQVHCTFYASLDAFNSTTAPGRWFQKRIKFIFEKFSANTDAFFKF